MTPQTPLIRSRLLDWYDAHARTLPWRAPPNPAGRGPRSDPYRVWLSEVMLQQTTVVHATDYFLAFTRRWPSVAALAAARDDEVMAAWAGLGYYARARNLLRCARAVAAHHDGVFPDTEAGLLTLPGVGAYTAAAVAAIAFNRPANVVDGNVERVMARLFAIETPLPQAKPELRDLAARFVSEARPGDWAQALMDLGATVCRPRRPACDLCPLDGLCAARASGASQSWPRRAPKPERPRRHGVAWVLEHNGEIALVRRPPRGLLGGMLALPTTRWSPDIREDEAATAAPAAGVLWRRMGMVEHVFTHFALSLEVRHGFGEAASADLIWTAKRELEALPSVFLKAARLALGAGGAP